MKTRFHKKCFHIQLAPLHNGARQAEADAATGARNERAARAVEDVDTLADLLCGIATAAEAAALDPNVVKRSGAMFRLQSFLPGGGGAHERLNDQPAMGPGAQTVAALRGALRVIDWAGEVTKRGGSSDAMGMRGVVAAATLIHRVSRRGCTR